MEGKLGQILIEDIYFDIMNIDKYKGAEDLRDLRRR
jgi:hypothetical protein